MLTKLVYNYVVPRVTQRKPDCIIGLGEDQYLLRWWIIPKNRFFNIYLHRFLRSDDDRALHDHPWPWASWILHGRYYEHTIAFGGIHHRTEYSRGSFRINKATHTHRVEVIDDEPIWTLFFTGPKIREWGFHTENGWVHWKDFVDPEKSPQECT